MTIAATVQRYLSDHHVDYDVLEHPRTLSSMKTAEAGHVSGDRLAKAVVLRADSGYMMAVLPASCHVELGRMRKCLDQPVGLATEQEIARLFEDCEVGAVPAIGGAYGLDVIIDDRLEGQPDLYFEGGDHMSLVHMSAAQFHDLMPDMRHGAFSRRD
jgi:Ala-tRNA(Pro) deacylase